MTKYRRGGRPSTASSSVQTERVEVSGFTCGPAIVFTSSYCTGPQLRHVHTFDALVAAPGFSENSVFTSPNKARVPQFAVAHGEIITYGDGRWGRHEYSRWPQMFDVRAPHVCCIPCQGSSLAPDFDILWRDWAPRDWTGEQYTVLGYGKLLPSLSQELESAARSVMKTLSGVRSYADYQPLQFILTCLHHTLDRLLLLPSLCTVAIGLAAHVQRLVLELVGIRVYLDVVKPRLESRRDHRDDLLDVLGAHTGVPSEAQSLHYAGVPVWFQQLMTQNIVIWEVDSLHPHSLSTTPSVPRLILASRDQSGILNHAGEAKRAMTALVHKELCGGGLPRLVEDAGAGAAGPPPKKSRTSGSTAGPVLVVRNPKDSAALGHTLRPSSSASAGSSGKKTRAPKKDAHAAAAATRGSFNWNPFRRFYESASMEHSSAWSMALAAVGDLPQPSAKVAYYFPPPWLVDRLQGYDASDSRCERYLHHWLAIREFCHLRLFDRTIAGRPLTIAEWRHALWGEYTAEAAEPAHDLPAAPVASSSTSGPSRSSGSGKGSRAGETIPSQQAPATKKDPRQRQRHEIREAIAALFGRGGRLPSYSPSSCPLVRDRPVSLEDIRADRTLQARLIWAIYETNWRCELLALDAIVMDSAEWTETARWEREALVARVWGCDRSGLAVCPPEDGSQWCWASGGDPEHEVSTASLRAFISLLHAWPACPAALDPRSLDSSDVTAIDGLRRTAVRFYVQTFVEKFERLPVPPVRPRVRM